MFETMNLHQVPEAMDLHRSLWAGLLTHDIINSPDCLACAAARASRIAPLPEFHSPGSIITQFVYLRVPAMSSICNTFSKASELPPQAPPVPMALS